MKVAILAMVALTGCVEAGSAENSENGFPNEEWVLVQMDGRPAPFVATANLGEAGRISGQAPCNRYFADATISGTAIKIGPIGATRMMCLQAKGEAEFLAALSLVDQVREANVPQGGFVLSGNGHELVFEQSAK